MHPSNHRKNIKWRSKPRKCERCRVHKLSRDHYAPLERSAKSERSTCTTWEEEDTEYFVFAGRAWLWSTKLSYPFNLHWWGKRRNLHPLTTQKISFCRLLLRNSTAAGASSSENCTLCACDRFVPLYLCAFVRLFVLCSTEACYSFIRWPIVAFISLPDPLYFFYACMRMGLNFV